MKSEAGRSQDFFRGTHNSPNRGSKIPVPPPPHFSNGPSLSNDDGEGNENVPSYLNECVFNFNSLKMANIGELPYGILETAKFGLREEFNLFLCLRPPNKVAKGNLTSCSHKLKRKARCSSFTYWARFVWRSRCCRRNRRLRRCSEDLSMCVTNPNTFLEKNACHLFTRYIYVIEDSVH